MSKTKSPPNHAESSKKSSNESKNTNQKLVISLLILIIAILIGFIYQLQSQIKPNELEINRDLLYKEIKEQLKKEIIQEYAVKESNAEEPKKIKDEPKVVEKVELEKPKIEDKIVIEDKKIEDLSSAELNFQNGKTISLDSKEIKIKTHESSKEEIKKEQPKMKKEKSDKVVVPKEVENFHSTKISKMKTKKMWIPIPNSNGGHRRVPPIEIKFGKEHSSSVKVWLFEEFLSQEECDHLIKAHESHLKQLLKQKPIICFDSVSTLKKNLIELNREKVAQLVTDNEFTSGTTCLNQTFSRQLEKWGLKWSYSTAFYPGESKFSKIFGKRIEDATMLNETHGGKFQITSYPSGIGYKDHTDCVLNSEDQRDRYATFLVYLNELGADGGGETVFNELGIDVKPRQGRALTWNNMNYETGKCEAKSVHKAAPVLHQVKKKYIIQRWYYYKNFYALGKRMAEAVLPEREPNTPKVSCDNYDNGSCRMYDEWNPDHIVDYQREKKIY